MLGDLLLLVVAAANPGVLLDVYEDVEMSIGGREQHAEIGVTRFCTDADVVLMADTVVVHVVVEEHGVTERPAEVRFPFQVCSVTSQMLAHGELWLNATHYAEPGVWNATAWVRQGLDNVTQTFRVTLREPGYVLWQGHDEHSGRDEQGSFVI